MKYFTKELWIGFQEPDDFEEGYRIWKENYERYIKQLEALKERLNQTEYNFFTKESLHDGELVSLRVIDTNSMRFIEKKKSCNNYKNPINVEIIVLNGDGDLLYTITYSKVARFNIDFSSDAELFDDYFRSFGDWGYDELSSSNESLLSHEILFSTGAMIKVEFKSIKIKRKKIKITRRA
jgi:hypothetical protein